MLNVEYFVGNAPMTRVSMPLSLKVLAFISEGLPVSYSLWDITTIWPQSYERAQTGN
jgi:hypothetical protein